MWDEKLLLKIQKEFFDLCPIMTRWSERRDPIPASVMSVELNENNAGTIHLYSTSHSVHNFLGAPASQIRIVSRWWPRFEITEDSGDYVVGQLTHLLKSVGFARKRTHRSKYKFSKINQRIVKSGSNTLSTRQVQLALFRHKNLFSIMEYEGQHDVDSNFRVFAVVTESVTATFEADLLEAANVEAGVGVASVGLQLWSALVSTGMYNKVHESPRKFNVAAGLVCFKYYPVESSSSDSKGCISNGCSVFSRDRLQKFFKDRNKGWKLATLSVADGSLDICLDTEKLYENTDIAQEFRELLDGLAMAPSPGSCTRDDMGSWWQVGFSRIITILFVCALAGLAVYSQRPQECPQECPQDTRPEVLSSEMNLIPSSVIIAALVSSFGAALRWFFDVGALVGWPPDDDDDDDDDTGALSESGITLFVSNAAVLFDPLCDSFLGWKDVSVHGVHVDGDAMQEVNAKSALTVLREELRARTETPVNTPADMIIPGHQVFPSMSTSKEGPPTSHNSATSKNSDLSPVSSSSSSTSKSGSPTSPSSESGKKSDLSSVSSSSSSTSKGGPPTSPNSGSSEKSDLSSVSSSSSSTSKGAPTSPNSGSSEKSDLSSVSSSSSSISKGGPPTSLNSDSSKSDSSSSSTALRDPPQDDLHVENSSSSLSI